MQNSEQLPASPNMRQLALWVAGFVLPLLLGWSLLEWWAAQLPTSHTVKRENLYKSAAAIDTLIVGSSGAYWGISPAELPGSAFNLANVAQTFYYDDQLVTRVLPQLPRLRRVILGVAYVSLFFQLQDTDEEERQYYYYQDWGIPPPRLRDGVDIRMFSKVALRTPVPVLESFAAALRSRARGGRFAPAPLDPPVDERGWSPREPGNPDDLQPSVIETKLRYHHGLMHLSDLPDNLRSLQHLIGILKQRGVELILVTTPVWKTYSSNLRPEYADRMQATLTALSHNDNVRYLPFLTAPQFDAADFLDADHLNQRGAVRFTRLLSAAIQGHNPR